MLHNLVFPDWFVMYYVRTGEVSYRQCLRAITETVHALAFSDPVWVEFISGAIALGWIVAGGLPFGRLPVVGIFLLGLWTVVRRDAAARSLALSVAGTYWFLLVRFWIKDCAIGAHIPLMVVAVTSLLAAHALWRQNGNQRFG